MSLRSTGGPRCHLGKLLAEPTSTDVDYLFHTAVLMDACLFPNENVQPSSAWKVDASQLVGFLDPSMRSIPQGELVVERLPNYQHNGKQYADLRVHGDELWIDLLHGKRWRFISGLEGTFRYDPSDGRIETANLRGEYLQESAWADLPEEQLLFRVGFWTPPILTLSYSCQVRGLGSSYTAR